MSPALEIRKALSKHHLSSNDINYVLMNDEGDISAVTHERTDPENITLVTAKEGEPYFIEAIPDWDFNVDDYLLQDLENGYGIVYMDQSTHYDVWCSIDGIRDEIQFENGLQKYLAFCQKNDITVKSFSSLGMDKVDIMDLYDESNQGYKIIQELTIDQQTIVLGHSKTNPSPYVTWETNRNRDDGYRSGHYFVNIKDAQRDFEERSKSLFYSKIEKLPKHRKNRDDNICQR